MNPGGEYTTVQKAGEVGFLPTSIWNYEGFFFFSSLRNEGAQNFKQYYWITTMLVRIIPLLEFWLLPIREIIMRNRLIKAGTVENNQKIYFIFPCNILYDIELIHFITLVHM